MLQPHRNGAAIALYEKLGYEPRGKRFANIVMRRAPFLMWPYAQQLLRQVP